MIISIIVINVYISWQLALIVLTTTLLSFVAASFFVKISQKYFRIQASYNGHLNGHIEEIYSGHIVVKVFDYETAYEEFERINDELFRSSTKSVY